MRMLETLEHLNRAIGSECGDQHRHCCSYEAVSFTEMKIIKLLHLSLFVEILSETTETTIALHEKKSKDLTCYMLLICVYATNTGKQHGNTAMAVVFFIQVSLALQVLIT